jgi:hypothetical protein
MPQILNLIVIGGEMNKKLLHAEVLLKNVFTPSGSDCVFQQAELVLPAFPFGPNESLLKKARLHPDMKVCDFVYMHLKHARNLDRLCTVLFALDITPELLCKVNPTHWTKYLKGFGPACAKSLYDAMLLY